MPMVYDYIVHMRVTRKGGAVEEYRHPVQAYGIQDAALSAIYELDAEHGIAGDGDVCKVLSIRPDVAKVGEETRSLMERAANEAARALRDAVITARRKDGTP